MHYMSTMFASTAAPNDTAAAANNSFAFDVASDKLWTNNKLNDENSAVGILLAVKALVQLIMTPFVTSLINSYGYRIPTAFGTFMLFMASFSMCNRCPFHTLTSMNSHYFLSIAWVAFALGTNYFLLVVARAMQGVASACISVCGMSIIAQVIVSVHFRGIPISTLILIQLESRCLSFIQRRRSVHKCWALYWAAWHWVFCWDIRLEEFCTPSLENQRHFLSSPF